MPKGLSFLLEIESLLYITVYYCIIHQAITVFFLCTSEIKLTYSKSQIKSLNDIASFFANV